MSSCGIRRSPRSAAAVGAGGGLYHDQRRPCVHSAKAQEQRGPCDQVIARLRTNLAKIQGITLYMQAAQDITIGGRLNKTQYQYTTERRRSR